MWSISGQVVSLNRLSKPLQDHAGGPMMFSSCRLHLTLSLATRCACCHGCSDPAGLTPRDVSAPCVLPFVFGQRLAPCDLIQMWSISGQVVSLNRLSKPLQDHAGGPMMFSSCRLHLTLSLATSSGHGVVPVGSQVVRSGGCAKVPGFPGLNELSTNRF
nr:hypothetical protein CFP56_20275 [Quercus suber]